MHELLQVHQLNTKQSNNICYLIPIGDIAEAYGVNLALELRQKNIRVAFDYSLSTKKRMKIADREGYPVCLIFGDDELESGEFILRNMCVSQEKRVHIEELDEALIQLLSL